MNKLIFLAVFVVAGVAGIALATTSHDASKLPVIELTPDNTVVMNDSFDDDTVAEAQAKFAKLLKKRKNASYDLYLVLDSPGGSVSAGMRLFEFLRNYEGINTITLRSYSMAAMISQLLPGQRYVIESGEFLFHKIKLTIPSPSTPEDNTSTVEFIRSHEFLIESKVAARAKLTLEYYREKTQVDWILSAQQAEKQGFVDAIVSVKCSEALTSTTTTKTVQLLPFLPPIDIKVSNCPLML